MGDKSTPTVKEAMIRLADRHPAMSSRSPPYYHLGAADIRDTAGRIVTI